MSGSSPLVWLDLSERAQRLARNAIDELRIRGTLDELGLGSVRDVLSDALSPGTSTIMTRARYYLFSAWIYKAIEKSSGRRERAPTDEIRRQERRLRDVLLETVPKNEVGVIGAESARRGGLPKRLPTEIYWSGLRTLGLRVADTGVDRYVRGVARGAFATEVEEADAKESVWDESMPRVESAVEAARRRGLSLSKEEAEYLRSKIESAREDPGVRGAQSLLLWLVDLPAGEFSPLGGLPEAAWEKASTTTGGSFLREACERALWLSRLMHGAQLLYNELVEEELVRAAPEQAKRLGLDGSHFKRRKEDWIHGFRDQRGWFAERSTDWFWRWAPLTATGVRSATSEFVNGWAGLVLADPRSARGRSARQLVAKQERNLKGTRSRLAGLDPKRWMEYGGSAGAGALDFRWGVTWRIAADVRAGLGKED